MEKHDIYLCRYKNDNDDQVKTRPCLVLRVDGDWVKIAPITGAEHSKWRYDYDLKDWKEEGLRKPSRVKFKYPDIWFYASDLFKYVGHLTKFDEESLSKLSYLNKDSIR